MTEQEREVWKEAYKAYELYHERTISTGVLPKLGEELRQAYVKTGEHPLMLHLSMALINYFSDKAKNAARDEESTSEQLMMEGV